MIGRWRVFMGFMAAGLYAFLARPASAALVVGGALLAVAGLALRAWAAGYLEKGRRLAQDGPYAWVRHPLYAGSFLLALGFCLAGTDPAVPGRAALLWGVFFFLFFWVYPRRIREEEATLQNTFGDAWRAFTARNRRFLPRLVPFRRAGPDVFLWSRYRKNREHNALLGGLFGAVLLLIKHRLERG